MFKDRLQRYYLFVKITIMLFIQLSFDCETESFFAKEGGGARMDFVLY